MRGEQGAPSPLTLRQNVIWNGIGSLFYQGSQWLITVLVVVLSSNYENSGVLAYAMTVGNIYGALATYNVRTFQVSDVDNRYSAQNYVAFRFVTINGAFIVSMVYSALVAQSLSLVITIGIYLLFKADESFANVLYGVDQKAFRMDYIGISQMIRGVFVLLSFSASLLLFQSIDIAVFSMFASCLCVTLVYDVPHAMRFDRLRPSIRLGQVKGLLLMCLPAVLSAVLCGMVVAVARQYFGNQFGSEALGIYAAVATPSVVVQLLAQYLYNPALGPIAEQWARGSREGLRSLLAKLLVIMVGAIVVVVVCLSLAGDFLLTSVFGDGIADYTHLFPPVLIGTGLIALVWFLGDVLIVFRKTRMALLANAVNLAVALVSMVPLINTFYMNGINYVVILANLVAVILASTFVAYAIRQ